MVGHHPFNHPTPVVSRVIVTRKPPPKRSRGDVGGTDAYWVLGWVTLSPVSFTRRGNNDDDNKMRETSVVAGFLPADRPLMEYQDVIERLRTRARKEGPDEEGGSTCLTDSLRILAYWCPTTAKCTGNVGATTERPGEGTTSLPILNNQRGYPWWCEFGDVDSSTKASPLTSQTGYNQVLFYGLDDERSGFLFLDHYACGFFGNEAEWSLMIHRINQSSEILDIVHSGKVVERRCLIGLPIMASERVAETVLNRQSHNDIEQPLESSTSLVHRIQLLVVSNSLTILHLHRFLSMPSAISSENTRWWTSVVSCFSFYRSYRALYELSTFTTNSQSNICAQSYKPCLIPSRAILAKQQTARWDAFVSASIDMVLGFLLCAMLLIFSWYTESVGTSLLAGKTGTFGALKRQIGWLETFPAGFKLNVQLTHNMGREIQNLLHQQEQFLLATMWNPHFCQQYVIPCLAAVSAAGGWTTFLAVLTDLWRLENLHLIVLAAAFRRLYSAELYLLSGLFRLFRGKKRNPLRQRTDTMHYDAMQLLVGTVGFCICVFLWTTVMVYYTFFVFWNLAMHLPVVVLWGIYSLSLSMPWGSLLLRRLRPGWFPKDVYVEFLGRDSFSSPLSSHGKTDNTTHVVQISNLVSIPESVVQIVSDHVTVHLSGILKWYLRASLEVFFPRSSNSSPTTMPLAQLVDNLVPWEKTATSTTFKTGTGGAGIGNGTPDQSKAPKSKSD
jgi:hypothetical protein